MTSCSDDCLASASDAPCSSVKAASNVKLRTLSTSSGARRRILVESTPSEYRAFSSRDNASFDQMSGSPVVNFFGSASGRHATGLAIP